MASQMVFVAGQPMANNAQVAEYSTVEITSQLAGGKMHGGLARAGKVRKATPKVEKQETTKKQLVGRAKRRLQYNKRFVTSVGSQGRKKSPNSNQ